MQLSLIATFLLAASALAGRINYSAKYHNGQKIDRTSKNSNVPDGKEQEIVDHMHSWSNGLYSASMSRHNIVQVVNNNAAASKGAASEEVQDMQRIVNANIRRKRRSVAERRAEFSEDFEEIWGIAGTDGDYEVEA